MLPLHIRALALVVALSTTSAIIVTVAEMGHPSTDGYGAIATLLLPDSAMKRTARVVTFETATKHLDPVNMPQP